MDGIVDLAREMLEKEGIEEISMGYMPHRDEGKYLMLFEGQYKKNKKVFSGTLTDVDDPNLSLFVWIIEKFMKDDKS